MKKYAKETGNYSLFAIAEQFLRDARDAAEVAIRARATDSEAMEIDQLADLHLLDTTFQADIALLNSVFQNNLEFRTVIFPHSTDLLEKMDVLSQAILQPALNRMVHYVGHRQFLDNFPAPPSTKAKGDTPGVALDRCLATISGGRATALGQGANKFLGRLMQVVLAIPMLVAALIRITSWDSWKPMNWMATKCENGWTKYSGLAERGYHPETPDNPDPAPQQSVKTIVGEENSGHSDSYIEMVTLRKGNSPAPSYSDEKGVEAEPALSTSGTHFFRPEAHGSADRLAVAPAMGNPTGDQHRPLK